MAFNVSHGEELKKPLSDGNMSDGGCCGGTDCQNGTGHYNHWI